MSRIYYDMHPDLTSHKESNVHDILNGPAFARKVGSVLKSLESY
jgi:hypothetical protein